MLIAVQILCILISIIFALCAIASFEDRKAALQYMIFTVITLAGLIYLIQ